ncbi:hypothetical protein H740_00060 [Campylobacter showae CC57C]|uniref:Uncharacterized protein n=1 Tax=Campylobacter showae CC57C TaxID=1073353 RepID=M3INB8_9BACT|nr:hypothetical protein H740_00060 [Campylobacter showae CC57C]
MAWSKFAKFAIPSINFAEANCVYRGCKFALEFLTMQSFQKWVLAKFYRMDFRFKVMQKSEI